MTSRLTRRCIVMLAAALAIVSVAEAGDGCCAHCGCKAECRKVCRLVYEEKKVEVLCWGCKCEDFCVPGPSGPGCRHCETVCGTCEAHADGHEPHAKPKRFVWTEWFPSCAQVHTRKRLMRKAETVKVPSHKWVVEDLCPRCEPECQGDTVRPGVEVPAPPVADATLKYGVPPSPAGPLH